MPGQDPTETHLPARLRLGHIIYSNCFPVHSRLLDQPQPGDPLLVEGVPSALNALLAEGGVDVAPASSIEYAMHADRYRLLPDLVIGSHGPVRSIVFISDRPPEDLENRTVAIPTASATSVVLLKILLRLRWRAWPRFQWFDQGTEDPFARGANAALFIGDVALRRDLLSTHTVRLDLGLEWWKEISLPFPFALWQVASGTPEALRRLHATLLDSRAFWAAGPQRLAERYASHFQMGASELEEYWRDLTFDLDSRMVEGLESFYRLAVEIGELDAAPPLRWIE